MKYCPRCKTDKPLAVFGANKRKADGKQVYCIECRVEVNHDSYLRTKGKHNPKRRATSLACRQRNWDFVREYLSTHPCVDCGNNDLRVLEFDHVRGEKVDNISNLLQGFALQKLRDEVEKCDVRCANCHRIVTGERAGWRKSLPL